MTDRQLKMLDELLGNDEDRLSPWELGFVESLNRQRDVDLNAKQGHALDRVWERVFGDGVASVECEDRFDD